MYLVNVEESLCYWIKQYTLEHCRKASRLEYLAKQKLCEKVGKIRIVAEEVTQSNQAERDPNIWFEQFHQNLANTLSLDLNAMKKIVGGVGVERKTSGPDIQFFKEELNLLQQEISDTFKFLPEKMEEWTKRPFDILCKEMGGCCEQCPFCKAKCEMINPDHPGDHHVALHRPQCLGGYRWEIPDNPLMVLDVCTTSVQGNGMFRCKDTNQQFHPYKNYREIYPKWSIQPNSSRHDSSYWKRFVANYSQQIAHYFNSKVPSNESSDGKVLSEWKKLTRDEVLHTLKESFYTETT